MRDFSKTKRIVIKVGTNILSTRQREVDTEFIGVIAGQIAELIRADRQVILVTSGAIGMGASALGIRKQITEVKMRQACAAVGQSILMQEYRRALAEHGVKIAQVLLTHRILSGRTSYVNIKNTMETLLGMDVLPIVNENDSVSIDEIGLAFGDNDKLSALVASKIDAELLIMLTDVAGLHDTNPQRNKKAQLIPVVQEITPEIEAMAGSAGSAFATGGMTSKLAAVRIAANAGCKVVLADGRGDEVIGRIVAGEEIGTLFLPKRRLSNRKRWILNSHAQGRIEVDAGAAEAIRNNRSLLLVGITGVEGTFRAGEVVELGDVAKGVCDVSSAQLQEMIEQRGRLADGGEAKRRAVVHVNNLVVLDH